MKPCLDVQSALEVKSPSVKPINMSKKTQPMSSRWPVHGKDARPPPAGWSGEQLREVTVSALPSRSNRLISKEWSAVVLACVAGLSWVCQSQSAESPRNDLPVALAGSDSDPAELAPLIPRVTRARAVSTKAATNAAQLDGSSIGLTTETTLPAHVAQAIRGQTLYSFRADDLELKEALALFARANRLNIVPDLDVAGQITVDLHDLPLDTMMEAFLDAYGFHWEEKNGLIRVHTMETRIFTVDYPRLVRSGVGHSSASLGSGSGGGGAAGGGGGSGGSGGGGGGGSAGGGGGGGSGGGGAGGGGSGGGASGGGVGAGSGGGTSITQEDNIDFWKELEAQLKLCVSPEGRLIVDKLSGTIQVTDRPQVIKNLDLFLTQMQDRVRRQVHIEAEIYEVSLNDEFNLGVDWQQVVKSAGLTLNSDMIVRNPAGGVVPSAPGLMAAFVPSVKLGQIAGTVVALQQQGKVEAISQPRLRALNNQTAIIKVGTEQPFFSSSSGFVSGALGGQAGTFTNSTFQMITVGTVLSITPQIAEDEQITLDVSPVITSLAGTESSGGKDGNNVTAPVLDIKQSSSLIRVRSGETIVIGGLIQDKTTKTNRQVPVLGDIPLLGKAFRGTFQSKTRVELVIFLTTTIVD